MAVELLMADCSWFTTLILQRISFLAVVVVRLIMMANRTINLAVTTGSPEDKMSETRSWHKARFEVKIKNQILTMLLDGTIAFLQNRSKEL